MRIGRETWGFLAATLAVVVATHVDAWTRKDERGGFVSTRSAARRVFDGLGEVPPADVVITFAAVGAERVRLVPSLGGHAVEIDGVVAGPADPEAVEGIWASLRLATTLRAVPDDVDTSASLRGTIVVDALGESHRVDVAGATPDGVGLYATIHEAGEGTSWVVERELGLLLEQTARAHLSRRLLVLDPNMVRKIELGSQTVTRGADLRWRSEVRRDGSVARALLSTAAVDAKLDRVAASRLDPLLPGSPAPPAHQEKSGAAGYGPHLNVELWDDRRLTVRIGGACPSPATPDRLLIWRDTGWGACVDAGALEVWPLPGSGAPGSGRMVEPRLLPHPYPRVLRVAQQLPDPSTLRRDGGDWILSYEEEGRAVTRELGGAEVLGWYAKLHEAEVSATEELAPPDIDWTTDFTVSTDSTVQIRLRCAEVAAQRWCQRDDGPYLRVRTDELAVGFSAETFADRTLAKLATENARSLEIRGPSTVRQSAHFDMGVWRLDAPEHPDGDNALDEQALEGLLAALAEIRALRWTSVPTAAPDRVVSVELIPSRRGPNELEVALHPDCVAVVGEQAAVLDRASCSRLGRELLFADPLRGWVDAARTVEVTTPGATTVRFERRNKVLVTDDVSEGERAEALLRGLSLGRYPTLVAGDGPGEASVRLRFLPRTGAAFDVDVGEGWAAIVGSGWHYAQTQAEPKTDAADE